MMHNRYTALCQIARVLGKSTPFQVQKNRGYLQFMVFTDPIRNPPDEKLVKHLPPGAILVYRHFGADDRKQQARTLATHCRRRNIGFMIGADFQLAHEIRADGVHLPERLLGQIPRIKTRYRFRQISISAHGVRAARRGLQAGADHVVLSPVFDSNSPSAGQPLGFSRFALAVQQIDGPVWALGGITATNIKKVNAVSAGVALVSAGIETKAAKT